MDSDRILAYLAFQGGGAKGISHVGGLDAVNELNLEIGGVAGTSAGAIVAALVSAKYSGKEIFDGQEGRHMLMSLSGGRYADPTSLFTKKGWRSLQDLVASVRQIGTVIRWASGRWYQRIVTALAAITSLSLAVMLAKSHPGVELVLMICFLSGVALGVYRAYRGLCPLWAMRDVVDEALRSKLEIKNKGVTFRHLRDAGAIPLKIVATNVTDGCLELFSFETTPDVVVADAVCASIRIPFVFTTWSIEYARKGEATFTRREFIDGGLMSNLPSWTFDEERALNKKAVTIAFGLKGQEEGSSNHSSWLMSALNAVIAGPPQIHLRGINRLIYVPIQTSIGLLDFDASFERFKSAVAEARAEAFATIKFEVTEIPVLVRKLLKQMQDEIGQKIIDRYRGGEYKGTAPQFRAALAIQRPGDSLTLSLAYAVGQYSAAWEGVRVPLINSPAGDAWADRAEAEPNFELFEDGSDSVSKVFMDSAWMLSVPIPIFAEQPDESIQAGLAVVLILDCPYQMGSLAEDEASLDEFARFLWDNVIEHSEAQDLGRSVRRSVAWL